MSNIKFCPEWYYKPFYTPEHLAIICSIRKKQGSQEFWCLPAETATIKRMQRVTVYIKITSFHYRCMSSKDMTFIILCREKTGAVSGLSADPTLPRTTRRPCPSCGFEETVFFQSHDRRRDTPMTLYFVCCNTSCGHLWSDEVKSRAWSAWGASLLTIFLLPAALYLRIQRSTDYSSVSIY